MIAPAGAVIPAELPHVTAILRDAGLVDTTWMTEEHRDRGTAVHLAARFVDEGDLDRESLDPTVAPRLAQYERFLLEVRPQILAIEMPVVHELYRYQGTLDRIVRINGREGVLDIKGTTASDWHGVQLAAYAEAVTPARPLARWNLYLKDDAYRLVPRTNRHDWGAFKAALSLVNWRNVCSRS